MIKDGKRIGRTFRVYDFSHRDTNLSLSLSLSLSLALSLSRSFSSSLFLKLCALRLVPFYNVQRVYVLSTIRVTPLTHIVPLWKSPGNQSPDGSDPTRESSMIELDADRQLTRH